MLHNFKANSHMQNNWDGIFCIHYVQHLHQILQLSCFDNFAHIVVFKNLNRLKIVHHISSICWEWRNKLCNQVRRMCMRLRKDMHQFGIWHIGKIVDQCIRCIHLRMLHMMHQIARNIDLTDKKACICHWIRQAYYYLMGSLNIYLQKVNKFGIKEHIEYIGLV